MLHLSVLVWSTLQARADGRGRWNSRSSLTSMTMMLNKFYHLFPWRTFQLYPYLVRFWLIVKYFRLMATAMPVESLKKREAVASSSNIDSSKSELTVELNGLNSICQTQGRFFGLLNPSNIGLTVYYTTTVTATTTSTTPGPTVIKSFTVQGCTPSPFPYNICA
jgi:hypothetical protein